MVYVGEEGVMNEQQKQREIIVDNNKIKMLLRRTRKQEVYRQQ
jgi:hypothetical protein